MFKLLLITGELAEAEVKLAAKKLSADILVLPVSVAQFMNPKMVIDAINKLGTTHEKIIFPGLTRFNVSEVERAVNMPCFKGPSYASDLIDVIEKDIKLSKTHAADSLLEKNGVRDYKRVAEKSESKDAKFKVGALKIGNGFPPRIIAEIVDAPLLSDKEALDRAQYYLKSGADIIDVGAIAAEDNSDKLAKIIKYLKTKVSAPISIDSLNPNEINAGLRAGADLVLSLTSENMAKVEKWPQVAYVVIPDKDSLFRNLKEAEKLGFEKLIADPILAPPFNTVESLSKYYGLRKLYYSQPMMMGVGNVVELMDVDSIGINGLLGSMAIELDIQLLLTTENSGKTRNSVKELKRAIELSFLAKSKGALPKDLGFDLLLAKGKGRGLDFDIKAAHVIRVPDSSPSFKADPKGYFNIFVDLDKKEIIAAHFKDNYDFVFRGTNAQSISKNIIEKDLVSILEHAAYLGRELQKAEVYLKLRKGYVQDEDFLGL